MKALRKLDRLMINGAEYRAVVLHVTVRDAKGRPKAGTFELDDDGKTVCDGEARIVVFAHGACLKARN